MMQNGGGWGGRKGQRKVGWGATLKGNIRIGSAGAMTLLNPERPMGEMSRQESRGKSGSRGEFAF